ncbi:hypothetical protein [Paracoccus sediminilitoris]|uniref:hypothetical protein n=1 Tax=Paracoccus sediminilitoris TaxID=2202419 RepID=UPI000DBA8C8D|nr:hypothetical protein [Paracoccus sediminilitoris]
MEITAMQIIADTLRQATIPAQARAIIADPELAARAGETARRFAWYITVSARGGKVRQRHRPANLIEGPR